MEHRANADPVAREHQAAARGVPQRNRELAVQLVDEVEALLLVGMDGRLGVAAGLEDMPADFEIGAQFDVVENFSVEGDPDAAVFVTQGLAAGAQIDDRQTAVAEADAGRLVIAFRVGPPMRQRTCHASQGRPVNGAFVEMPESRNAAHVNLSYRYISLVGRAKLSIGEHPKSCHRNTSRGIRSRCYEVSGKPFPEIISALRRPIQLLIDAAGGAGRWSGSSAIRLSHLQIRATKRGSEPAVEPA